MNNELIQQESPLNLISLAIEKGADIEQLEKLLSLKERWDASQAKKSFLASISKFQSEVPTLEKKKQVAFGTTKYKYAELGEIDESIKGILAANGLSKRWEIKDENDKLVCTCIISHVDGHSEKTSMSSLKDSSGGKNEIQSRASAVTYLQRYTLIGALGLTTASEDNDAVGTPDVKPVTNTVQEDTREWLSEAKFNEGLKRIQDGEQGVYEALNTEFKIKKTYREVLQKAKPIKSDEPFAIPGHWHAKMEKCKTKKDVLAIYKEHKATVDAHPELQKLLKETLTELSLQTA